MKIGGAIILLVNFQSMEVSNLLDFPKYGVLDCRISSIFAFTLRPQVGAVVPMAILDLVTLVISLSPESGVEGFLIPL